MVWETEPTFLVHDVMITRNGIMANRALDRCFLCGDSQLPCKGRRLIAAMSKSASVHLVQNFLQRCCSIEHQEFFLCKACFSKAEKGAKSQAIVDAVRDKVGSFLRGRGPLGEETRILLDK